MKKFILFIYLALSIHGSLLVGSTCGDRYFYMKDTKNFTYFMGDQQTQDKALMWMVKSTGFNPNLVVRKDMVAKGVYKFGIPIDELNSEILELTYTTKILEGKKRVALLSKVETYKDGRKLDGEDKNSLFQKLKKNISKLKTIKTNKRFVKVVSKTQKKSFQYPVEINDDVLKRYNTFIENYFYSPNRNINVVAGREQERLSEISDMSAFKKLNSKIKRNNIKNYIYDRSRKQIGSWPIALSTAVIVVMYQDQRNNNESKTEKEGHVWELFDNVGNKYLIGIDQVGDKVNFTYDGVVYSNKYNVIILYDSKKIPYIFQVVFGNSSFTKLHLLESNI